MPADLHVHTTCSDSTMTPIEVVQECSAQHITIVAITDHDEVRGIESAERAAEQAAQGHEVRVVPGVEMTAYVGKQEIHVIGLFIDRADPGLCEILLLTREERHTRVHKMVALLQKLKINITVEDVMKIANGGVPGRPHVAQALVKIGQVGNISDAFKYYIGSGGPAYLPKYELSPAEAGAAIHKAGGVAIIAHPGTGLPDDLVGQMLRDGLDGLEAYHPLHSNDTTERYLRMARDLGVLAAGGSDCHGEVAEGTKIGRIAVPDELLDQIERRATEYGWKTG